MSATEITVGQEATVVIKIRNHLLPALFPNAPTTATLRGIVQARAAYDNEDSIRLNVGGQDVPVRVIQFSHILTWNGERFNYDGQPVEVKKPEPRFVIVGSKSDPKKQYKVTFKEDGSKTCTCTGFGYRGHCKHVKEVV